MAYLGTQCEVSDTAKVCAHCGCPINQKEKKNLSKKFNVVILIILLIVFIEVGFYYGFTATEKL